jgi:adenylate cyclase
MQDVGQGSPSTAIEGLAPMTDTTAETGSGHGWLLAALVVILLAGLPIAVWLDLRNLSEDLLRRQASDMNSLITSVRGFYSKNVVGRVLAAPGVSTQVIHNYQDIPGAIPIPATLSLELGKVINEQQNNINYRFVSDYPFRGRAPHEMDDFEKGALTALRQDANLRLTDVSWSLFTDRVRLVTPIIMGQACVTCHNANPDSPKHDWKVGDVRGIQEISISQPIATNIQSFKFLILYFLLATAACVTFIVLQRRQAAIIAAINRKLASANEFLAAVSAKISHYLSPQIYKSIFSGQRDVTIHTERKNLTIFFSDIKDFTATTERLQPEQITSLLNEYFTEMSAIALQYGGTIDKFVGDAIVIFFGDPETKGVVEDAKACLRMAVAMQRRIAELNVKWRRQGVEEPFRVRIGINTGICNVGNFGSSDRMDYTIIGGEANLAARLQSIAQPGHIVVSYETHALVRDIVAADALAPITMKGIGREVIPYTIGGLLDETGAIRHIFSEHTTGLDFYLDPTAVDSQTAERIRGVLRKALAALEKASPGGGPAPEGGVSGKLG